jgi:hypothetical protein
MTTPKATLAALRKHALTYPEATEEFPWGDRTIKVRGKIFVFLGAGKDGFGMSVKLPATHELALTRKGTQLDRRELPGDRAEDACESPGRAVRSATCSSLGLPE